MSSWLERRQKERRERLARLELVLLGIVVHGPSSLAEPDTARFVRWTKRYWQDAYQHISAAEREEWLCRQRPPEHAAGCACWDCVLRSHSAAARHQAELAVRARDGREAF